MKGPLVQVECPKDGAPEPGRPVWRIGDDPWWWFMQWQVANADGQAGGMGEMLELWDEYLATRVFLGDSYPQLWLNQGPGALAAYLTGHLRFGGNTTWFELAEPMPWKDIMKLTVEHDSPWFVRTIMAARDAAAHGRNRFVVGMADLGGIHDVLASLRTTEQLLEDCINDPRAVLEAAMHLVPIWHACFDELSEVIEYSGQYGTSAWMGLWAPARWYPIQCDFAAMLSPAMFGELVLPVLREQCACLDHSIYHWDGPGQIPHLDMLLSIPELDGLQWVPGAGEAQNASPKWQPLYERIQRAGKRLVLQSVEAGEVVPLLKRLDSRGVLVSTWSRSEEEGRALTIKAGISAG
jgi:5-methyltetrahydrofolate--homocysteine methyltransferase